MFKYFNRKIKSIFLISLIISISLPITVSAKNNKFYNKEKPSLHINYNLPLDGDKYLDIIDKNYAVEILGQRTKSIHFTEEEKNALYKYTESSFRLNNMLDSLHSRIDLLPDDLKQQSMNMDNAINKSNMPFNIKVYRYAKLSTLNDMGISDDIINKYYKNDVFDKGILDIVKNKLYHKYSYMSTTVIRDSVFNYRPIELIITIPKNTKAAYLGIAGFSAYTREQEILLPRNSLLKIYDASLDKDNKRLILYANYERTKKVIPATKINQPEISNNQKELINILDEGYKKAFSEKDINNKKAMLKQLDMIDTNKDVNKGIIKAEKILDNCVDNK